jgi:hypothetical protein
MVPFLLQRAVRTYSGSQPPALIRQQNRRGTAAESARTRPDEIRAVRAGRD